MRNLADVIDQMVEVIPANEETLIARLNATRQSVLFAAPELESFWWNMCAERLNDEIGQPTKKWQKQIGLIFSGRINESR